MKNASIILMFFIVLVSSCYNETIKASNEKRQIKELKSDAKEINWSGIWTYSDNAPVYYTLTIREENKGKWKCLYNATGIQTYYEIECEGINRGEYFELYFVKTKDGILYNEDKLNLDKPILTLKKEQGQIVTYWNQLFNNYVEEGNHDGQICFKK